MNTTEFVKRLACCEQQAETLNQNPSAEGQTALIEAVASISLPNIGDQSDNGAFYGLGQPKVDTVDDSGGYNRPASVTHPLGKTANFQTLQTNMAWQRGSSRRSTRPTSRSTLSSRPVASSRFQGAERSAHHRRDAGLDAQASGPRPRVGHGRAS